MQRSLGHLIRLQLRNIVGNQNIRKLVYFQIGFQLINHREWIVKCIEDKTVLEAQQKMKNFRSQMESKYGKQNVIDYQISMRGGKYMMQFTIDQRKTDIFILVVDVLNQMQQKVGSSNQSDQIKVKNVESFKQEDIITFQIEFTQFINNRLDKGTIYITGEMNNQRASIRFKLEKDNYITDHDIRTFQKAYEESNKPQNQMQKQKLQGGMKNTISNNKKQQNSQGQQQNGYQESLDMLKELGCTVFMPDSSNQNLDWDCLAGYERQKRAIEDTVLLALSYPEIYQDIMQGTRMKPDDNKPKAVLFEGPPGTGKTTSAKIISQQVQVPLVYLPLESIMSKYYGESEKRFSDIFQSCQSLGKVIVFIDEIDAIAGQRDSQMHEASRRILSTLLRKIDGFESSTEVLLICATNRKEDLDQAMLSRVDLSIKFDLPDLISRTQIYKRYAKQFSQTELEVLADASQGMSGRNISDICKNTERRWASKIIRKEVDTPLPTLDQYLESIRYRQSANLV